MKCTMRGVVVFLGMMCAGFAAAQQIDSLSQRQRWLDYIRSLEQNGERVTVRPAPVSDSEAVVDSLDDDSLDDDSLFVIRRESGFLISFSYTSRIGWGLGTGIELGKIIAAFVGVNWGGPWSEPGDAFYYGLSLAIPDERSRISLYLSFCAGSDLGLSTAEFITGGLYECDNASTYSAYSLGIRHYFGNHAFIFGAGTYVASDVYESGGCRWNPSGKGSSRRVSTQTGTFGVSVGVGLTSIWPR